MLLDNRHGLVTNVCVTLVTGGRSAKRRTLWPSVPEGGPLGADKGYYFAAFVRDLRDCTITTPRRAEDAQRH